MPSTNPQLIVESPTDQPPIEQFKPDMWQDPREKFDRRQANNQFLIPAEGCRRINDRRERQYISDKEWWLHRRVSK